MLTCLFVCYSVCQHLLSLRGWSRQQDLHLSSSLYCSLLSVKGSWFRCLVSHSAPASSRDSDASHLIALCLLTFFFSIFTLLLPLFFAHLLSLTSCFLPSLSLLLLPLLLLFPSVPGPRPTLPRLTGATNSRPLCRRQHLWLTVPYFCSSSCSSSSTDRTVFLFVIQPVTGSFPAMYF